MSARSLAESFWAAVQRHVRRVRPQAEDASHSAAARAVEAEALRQLDAIRAQCRALVTRRASLSAGAAIIPIPGMDLGTDVAILLKLLPQINEKFGLTPAQIDALDVDTKRIVLVLVSSVSSGLVGRLITKGLVVRVLQKIGVRLTAQGVVKYVPLLGQALAASISFGAMKMLGNKHVDDCYEVARRVLLERHAPNVNGDTVRGEWTLVP